MLPVLTLLAADMPPMIFDLIKSEVEASGDAELTAISIAHAMPGSIATHGVDAIIFDAQRKDLAAACVRALYDHPGAIAVVVSLESRGARILELDVRETVLGEVSPAELLSSIRARCWHVLR